MIIGENRAQVIENIKAAVKKVKCTLKLNWAIRFLLKMKESN